jgi:hypothetical protein
MVNPLVVRRHELISAPGGGRALGAGDVFTSVAGSPFSHYELVLAETGAQGGERQSLADAAWRVIWSELLRDETLPADELQATGAVIARWTAVHDELAQYLRENPAPVICAWLPPPLWSATSSWTSPRQHLRRRSATNG